MSNNRYSWSGRGGFVSFQLPDNETNIDCKKSDNDNPKCKFDTKVTPNHLTSFFICKFCILFYLLVELKIIIDDLTLSTELSGNLIGGVVSLLCHFSNIFDSFIMTMNLLVDLYKLTMSWISSESFVVHFNK